MAVRKKKKIKRPHGQLRRSQLVGGSGPGSLIDLPRHAGIIGGLEFWGTPSSPTTSTRWTTSELGPAWPAISK